MILKFKVRKQLARGVENGLSSLGHVTCRNDLGSPVLLFQRRTADVHRSFELFV